MRLWSTPLSRPGEGSGMRVQAGKVLPLRLFPLGQPLRRGARETASAQNPLLKGVVKPPSHPSRCAQANENLSLGPSPKGRGDAAGRLK